MLVVWITGTPQRLYAVNTIYRTVNEERKKRVRVDTFTVLYIT